MPFEIANGKSQIAEYGLGDLKSAVPKVVAKSQTTSGVIRELVQYLAKSLVSNPDAVEVTESESEDGSVLEIKVAKEDLGRIIGKQGRTAKSIRTLVNAAASRSDRKVILEIVEQK